MKALLVGEYREGRLLGSTYEPVAFAERIGAETAMFLVGSEHALPKYDGPLYLAEAGKYGEFDPELHKKLLLAVVEKEKPDVIVLVHSSYGWDLAPRVAFALKTAQVSEVVDFVDGTFVVPACNAKLRRRVKPKTDVAVVTLQAGAFVCSGEPAGTPSVIRLETEGITADLEFTGYEPAEAIGVDLAKAEIVVGAGRGVGTKENMEVITRLAEVLGAEIGATRPVTDAGWVEAFRQIGTTGQVVSPKLYIACGISGAIQHLAGIKLSEFIVAVNTDKDAPIGEVADVLVVADIKALAPMLTEKLRGLKTHPGSER